MRRIYIAVILILICIFTAVITSRDIKTRLNKELITVNKIEKYIDNKDYNKAEKLCKKAADEFNSNDSSYMYIYYVHKDLAEISEYLYNMHDYIKHRKISDFYSVSGIIKSRIKTITDKEPINIRNIM